jgi:hypothetical protein
MSSSGLCFKSIAFWKWNKFSVHTNKFSVHTRIFRLRCMWNVTKEGNKGSGPCYHYLLLLLLLLFILLATYLSCNVLPQYSRATPRRLLSIVSFILRTNKALIWAIGGVPCFCAWNSVSSHHNTHIPNYVTSFFGLITQSVWTHNTTVAGINNTCNKANQDVT